jgi:aquaporin Z
LAEVSVEKGVSMAETLKSNASGTPQSDEEIQAQGRSVAAIAEATHTVPQLRSMLEFHESKYEWRRLFSELLGTFMLVFVAVGGGMVNAKFGGTAIPQFIQAAAPGLMVMSIILFMGAVSGAHLNPGVSLAFALRGDFPWRRVPLYIVAQFVGAILAALLLVALLGKQGGAGLTLPGPHISTMTALLWEIILTTGLVSVILGTASGAQAVGWGAAIGVGSYIALAGMVGAPVSGASMNTARSLGPAIALGDYAAWWAYLIGPPVGALIAVGFAHLLRGSGGDPTSRRAGSGTLD